MAKKILEIEKLFFKYKNDYVLKDINFTLEKGDFVGILGPNGSGKTTLLKNINRWLKPCQGDVYVDGKNVLQICVKGLAKKVATVPQNANLNTGFTVEQVVSMGRNPHLKNFEPKQKRDIEIIEDSLKSMDILHLRNKPTYQLSGGEKQRVLIARALAQQPILLLLDEPTSHLDINYQWELFGLLKKLCVEKSITILTVLHDINLASMFCNKIALIKNHKIFKMGNLEEVLNEKNIKDVFNMDVRVSLPRGRQHPIIIFLNQANENVTDRSFQNLHVVCGGGEGEKLLYYLNLRGYNVSTGVLNKGDTDWKVAQFLGFTIVEETPFSPITNVKMLENISYIDNSDAVILASIPFGFGNLKNLLCLKQLVERKKTFVLEEKNIQKRDYTNGHATEIYNKIKEKAIIFNSMEELKTII